MLVVALVLTAAFLAAVVVLAAENKADATVYLPGYRVDAPLYIALAAAGVVGAVLGFLVGLWGLLRRMLIIRRLRSQVTAQQRTIASLEQQLTAHERAGAPTRALPVRAFDDPRGAAE